MSEELTEKDVEKLQAEMEELYLVRLPKVLREVQEAAAQGDRSENAEYKASKQEKRRIESRIRYLKKVLENARIVKANTVEGVVGINNTVVLYDEDDEEETTVKIVTSIRVDSVQNKISRQSPLGDAIFGRKVGDRCLVRVNDSYSYYVQIRAVDVTSSEDDDEIRSV